MIVDAAGLEHGQQVGVRHASQRARGRLPRRLDAGRQALVDVVEYVVREGKERPNAVYAGSVPYLMLAGTVVAGWQMARALLAAEARLAAGDEGAFMRAKVATARFYAEHILVEAPTWRERIVEGAESVTAFELEAF
jgi:hypothetical protein